MAKAAGSLIWAPMNRLQSMATHPTLGPLPLTLQDAYRLARQICSSSDGLFGLWTGYTKSFTSLLPYTMLYFATYEQCKHAARWLLSETAQRGGGVEVWSQLFSRETAPPDPNRRSLTPATYMVCVSSAVVISSTLCQTAIAVRDNAWARFQSRAGTKVTITEPALTLDAKRAASTTKRPAPIASFLHPYLHSQSMLALPGSPSSPISPVSPTTTSRYPSALTMVASATPSSAHSNIKLPTFVPSQLKTLMSSTSTVASQALSSLPWQPSQHATFATTSLMPFRSGGVHSQQLAILKAPLKGYPPGSLLPASTATPSPSSTHSVPASTTSVTPSNNSLSTRLNTPPKNNLLMTMMRHDREMKMKMKMIATTNNMTPASTASSTKNLQGPGLLRIIARGLGPRILWTIPGVTLTTAGFEMFRNLAAGPST
jgi:hypothetical protein